MNKLEIKSHLVTSIVNFKKRKGTITLENLEAEVILNACFFILKNYKNKTIQAKTIEEQLEIEEFVDYIVSSFTEAAKELFPEYTEGYAEIAKEAVRQNLAWGGMWDYLRKYFKENHGISID